MKRSANATNVAQQNVLLANYLNGQSGAIEEIIAQNRSKVYGYVLSKVQNNAVADDITQETFIKVVDSLNKGKYTDDGRFMSWVLRIAHNLIIDHFRLTKRRKEVGAEDQTMELLYAKGQDYAVSVEKEIIKDETQNQLHTLVNSLPKEQREVVEMRHFMDLSYKEIAEQTGVSINTALGRMRYALINLRREANTLGLELA